MLDKRKLCGTNLDSVGIVVAIFYIIDSCVSQSLDGLIPGEDFPDFPEVPQGLSFTCNDKLPGYYADPETQCQVWHWCVPSIGGNVMYSFLCGAGTVFNQRTRVCDWFFKVDCPSSPDFYGINEDLYKDEAGNYIAGRKTFTRHNERQMRKARKERRNKPLDKTTESNPVDKTTKNITFRKKRHLFMSFVQN